MIEIIYRKKIGLRLYLCFEIVVAFCVDGKDGTFDIWFEGLQSENYNFVGLVR